MQCYRCGNEEIEMRYPLTEKYVRTYGRTLIKGETLYLGYSCTGIGFTCTTKRVEAHLWSNSNEWESDLKAVVAVFVDDVLHKRIVLEATEADYVLYESDEERTVKISLVKLSEAAFAYVGIKEIHIEGNDIPKPIAPSSRKIEFIGDSITCGYGIEGIWNESTFNTREENPWEAYAATTARNLNAAYHLVCWSGNGVLSGWTETGEISNECLMPELYEYTDLALERALGVREYEKWNSHDFEADCVVINLGTNDASYTRGQKERVAAFGQCYYEFLVRIREKQPTAYIVCTLGVMGADLYPEIEAQVERFKKEQKDERITAMAFALQEEKDGIGTDWHPSRLTQKKMAHQLTNKLKSLLSWV